MNRVRWVAWGVIELDDATKFDRQQRRSYLRKLREELGADGWKLECGGSTRLPHYRIFQPVIADGREELRSHAAGGPEALKKVCTWLLLEIGDHERSEDGSLRGAGAEAEGA